MNLASYTPDILYLGITLSGCIPMISRRIRRWWLLVTMLTVISALLIWMQLLPARPIAQLSPAIAAMFMLPGFLVLELVLPALARQLSFLERGPLLFSISMAVWTLIAAVAYRIHLASDLVISGILAGDIIGLLAVFIFWSRHKDLKLVGENNKFNYINLLYIACLIVALLIISGVVGFSAEYQRYDFDSSTHLGGYHKIADSAKIIGGNPFLGQQYFYYTHYIANPWYLVFGLSARLAATNVAWLYVYLAAVLTPLFFLGIYSLLKALAKDDWIAITGTLLVIGPWISQMALTWGPPMGTFYLQFLPTPEPYATIILFPAWLAYCFRYVQSPTSENWIAAALLAIAAMGVHPEFLLLIPYSIGIVFIISMFFMTRHDKIKTFVLAAFTFISASIIAYLIINPIGRQYLKDGWVVFDKEDVLRQLLEKAWIISPNLYAVHPRFLLTPESLKNVISIIVITLFIWFQPRLSIEKISKEDTDSSVSMPKKFAQRRLAVAVAAVFAGPYLILYNPVVVPIIVTILGSAIPIRLIEGSYEVFLLVCKFGAIAGVISLMLQSNRLYKYGKILKLILLFFILIIGIGWSVGRPSVRSLILGMIYRGPSVASILDMTKDTLFKGLAKLKPGIVAIDMKLSEYLVMTTPHHVVSATRATKERQLDNEKIVNFSLSAKGMKELITKYNFNYVVVPLDGKLVLNGEFSTGTSDWDAVGTAASESKGYSGKCLQLTGTGNGMPFVYQNVTLAEGKFYKIEGYVKSGTSGNEPFAIQIYQHNASGHGEFSVDGVTTDSWRRYSAVFRANYRELSILLRKMSPTPGTMLFDSIALYEVVPRNPSVWENIKNKNGEPLANNRDFIPNGPLYRFREHQELFYEILTLEKYAVFKVKN